MKDYINQIICGDSMEVLKAFPSQSVDLVWTSPPYNLGNFNKGSFYGGKVDKGNKLIYDNYCDKMSETEYVQWQNDFLRECYRIIKETGAIFYNHKPRICNGIFDDRRNLIPFPVRQEIIWNRCCMHNFSGGFYAPNTERIFIITKGNWKPNKEYLGWGEVWSITPETDNPHPAPFPLKLAIRVIVSGSKENGIVLDPMCGSGTTCVAAYQHKRKFIGIDISEKYCRIARQRMKDEMAQLTLF